MILLVLLVVAFAPHHSNKSAPRHPSEVHVVAPRELAVEPVASATSLATPEPAPARTVVTPLRVVTAEPPDFRTAIAQQLETLPICRRPGGTEGPGIAEVTYLPNGTARISLSGNYANSAVGACVARRFGNAARSFDGEPVTVKVRFVV